MPQSALHRHGFAKRLMSSDAVLTLVGLAIIMAVATAFSEYFLTTSNIASIAKSQSIIAVMGLGQLLVLITGGIDISVGSTFGMAGSIVALLLAQGHSPVLAVAAALLAGLIVGLLNGLFIARLRLAPFIVTLGMMGIVRGITFVIADAQSISIDSKDAFLALENSNLLGCPMPIAIAIVLGVLAHVFLNSSVLGGRIYAIGGDEGAARMLGVNVPRVTVFCYAVCGLAAALGGAMGAAKVAAAYPNAGSGYEFEVIASLIVGGVSPNGGKGTVLASMLGAMFIGVLKNAIVQMDISQYWQQTVSGFAIIFVIMVSVMLSRLKK